MKVHYPKLYNMAHLSLNVFTASKGSNNYILFYISDAMEIQYTVLPRSPDKIKVVYRRYTYRDQTWFSIH